MSFAFPAYGGVTECLLEDGCCNKSWDHKPPPCLHLTFQSPDQDFCGFLWILNHRKRRGGGHKRTSLFPFRQKYKNLKYGKFREILCKKGLESTKQASNRQNRRKIDILLSSLKPKSTYREEFCRCKFTRHHMSLMRILVRNFSWGKWDEGGNLGRQLTDIN